MKIKTSERQYELLLHIVADAYIKQKREKKDEKVQPVRRDNIIRQNP